MAFELTMIDGETERVDDADSYELEGPLTTFFLSGGSSGRLSSWSQRVASFRTERVLSVRRIEIPALRAVG